MLAAEEGFEADLDYFSRGFGFAAQAAGDVGHRLEFGFGEAGAESADADAVAGHFLGQAFGEDQVERLGGGIYRHIGYGLIGSGGGEDENVTALTFDHCREIEMGEVDDGGTVNLYHADLAAAVEFGEFTVVPVARVVDQEIDGEVAGLGEIEDLAGTGGVGEVGGDALDFDRVVLNQLSGKGLQAVEAAGGEDQVRFSGCELFGEDFSDARAGAGDEGPLAFPVGKHVGH